MSHKVPEFGLAAACCRWPPSPIRDGAVTAASKNIDWPLFAAVAKRHRVESLVWAALKSAEAAVPNHIAAELRREALQIAQQNLRLASESVRLKEAFDHAGIQILFVKGLTLGTLAYGSIALKKGWDVDLLIPPDRICDAACLLVALGYFTIVPENPSAEQLAAWHRHSKESVWRHRTSGMVVELHTALVNNPAFLPNIGIGSPRVEVEVTKGVVLPTLRRDELFAYLCVHGASSAWFRLKWLADLAALAGQNAGETERLYCRALELGAARAAGQALLLASDLLQTPIPAPLGQELRASAINRGLAAAAKRLLVGPRPAAELHERTLGTLPIHLSQFWLRPGLRYKWTELKDQLRNAMGV